MNQHIGEYLYKDYCFKGPSWHVTFLLYTNRDVKPGAEVSLCVLVYGKLKLNMLWHKVLV